MSDKHYKLFNSGQGSFLPESNPPSSQPKSMEVMLGGEKKQVPCSYMWKDVLIPGEFQKHVTGQTLSLNSGKIEDMAKEIKKYLANGNLVPIPYRDHDESTNAGFVVDAKVDKGRLFLLHQFIGERATVAALQNRVSVEIHAEKTDPKGNKYKNLIVHSSLTDDPVVTGQLPWEPLAASRGEHVDAPLYIFAASGTGRSKMDWAKIRKLLGVGDDVPQSKLEEMLAERMKDKDKVATLETEKTTLSNKVTTLENEKKQLRTDLDAKTTEAVSLSNKINKVVPSARELFFARSALTAAKDKAVTSGAVNAATADKIISRFAGEKGKIDAISLSATTTEADIGLAEGMARAIDTFEALEGNKAGPASSDESKTGDQGKSKERTQTNTKAGEKEGEEEDKDKDKDKDKPSVSKAVSHVTGRYRVPKGLEPAGSEK